MNIKDEALIIYSKIINENNLLVKLMTKDNGLCSGIIYGGNSKKNRLTYQIGSFINFNLLKKNENSISSITGDLRPPLLSNFFDNKYKLYAILTCCELINITVNENQKFKKIYDESVIFFISLTNNHWFYEFSRWIINFLSQLGYGIDLDKIKLKKKYIYLRTLEFFNKSDIINLDQNYIEFPYDLILEKIVTFKQCSLLFFLFENIMQEHLLNHSPKKIPNIYFDFKKIILQSLK